jgi:hypothetical protein
MNAGHGMPLAPVTRINYGPASTRPNHQSNSNVAPPPQQQGNMNAGRGMLPAQGQASTRPNRQSNSNVAPPPQQQGNIDAGRGVDPAPPRTRKRRKSRSPPGTFNAENCYFPTLQGAHQLIDYLTIPHGSNNNDPGIDPPPVHGVLGSWPYQYPADMEPDPNNPTDDGLLNLARRVFRERRRLSSEPGLVALPNETVTDIRDRLCGREAPRKPLRAKVNSEAKQKKGKK